MRVGIETLKSLASPRGFILQLAMVAVATGALMFSPLSTQKAAAAMICTKNYVCMWEHSYGGGSSIMYGYLNRYTCYTLPGGWWDRMSSLYNRLDYSVYFYSLSGCGGWSVDLGAWELRSDLSGTGMNDEIRSFWVN